MQSMRIGVDFDNTIVNYDYLFYQAALQRRLVKSDIEVSKDTIRKQIRNMDNGEIIWQKLQAHVYTRCMHEAVLIKGVAPFFKKCKDKSINVFIVSHKTQYANHDLSGIDLRNTALSWMQDNGFFDESGLACQKGNIYFESTRIEKLYRIKQLKCTHFIDDLVEIFSEKEFPEDVEKILYVPSGKLAEIKNVKSFTDWKQIYDYFFK